MAVSNHYMDILLREQFADAGLPEPVREYRFCERRFRFDYAWPGEKVALEIEGGIWVRGRHTRPRGYERDCEKYSLAAILGWKVIRATPAMLEDGRALDLVAQALGTDMRKLPVEEWRRGC